MPISIQPPPEDGSLAPSGSPPSVQVTVTVPGGGRFNASLVAGGGRTVLETGFLRPGQNTLRIFLPSAYPPGSKLVIRVRDVSGSSGNFAYSI